MQKIVPFMWFDHHAEEAMTLYTSLFKDGKITRLDRIASGPAQGNVIGAFQLQGQEFQALDGGPYYQFSPAISYFVNCESLEEMDTLWHALAEGGMVLMELDAYPFSARFGWLQDRYGVSWQLHLNGHAQPIAPFLLFVGDQCGKAEEAIGLYTSLFPDSAISSIAHHGADGPETAGTVSRASFSLAGQNFMAMDSSLAHAFSFTGGISFYVNCESQDEIDRIWEKLLIGGEAQQCGWIKDRYGVVWQIAPAVLGELLQQEDPEKAQRVMGALMGMVKIDIAALRQAVA